MDLERPLILFGDRDLGWSLPLCERLRIRGIRVAEAASAQHLLALVQRSRPDLVVLGQPLGGPDGRMLTILLQERSPETRIIRVLPPNDPAIAEPGPADNVLCTMNRLAVPEELAQTIVRVLSCAPRGTQRYKAPLVVSVDDDRQHLESLARMMRRQGYRVLSYSEPELALEELPFLKPDLLILDELMPGVSGSEMLDEVKRYCRWSLPVVLLSDLDSDERTAQGRKHGAAGYLTKPCSPETLLELVHGLLARSGTASRHHRMTPRVPREPQEAEGITS